MLNLQRSNENADAPGISWDAHLAPCVSSGVSWPQVCRAWLVGEGTFPSTNHLSQGRELSFTFQGFNMIELF